MIYLIYFFIFIFGLIIGSFLNAVIYRLEAGKSVFRGRSFCPKCKHILSWYDLVPIFSFIFLLGKCRYCRQKISIQYPLVELATALLFTAFFLFEFRDLDFIWNLNFGFWNLLNIFYWFYIVSILIVTFVYDLKHYIIPDKIILPAIVISLIWNLAFEIYLKFGFWNLDFKVFNNLLAALGAAGFFFSLILISRGKWMGFGDVKLVFLMGLVLDFPAIILALFTAFMSGAIIGIGLILFKKKGLKSQIPFGPFLVGGTIFSLFFGEIIINWYLNFLL